MSTNIFTPKFLLVFTLIILPCLNVQAGGGMSEEQMQQMMEQAQKIQECMAKIDQSAMDAFAAKAEKMHKDMEALCAAGKRDQAQSIAITYGKEISASKEMKGIKKCSEMATGMMQQMPMMQNLDKDYDKRHVCDGM
jgi:hypothetical protein